MRHWIFQANPSIYDIHKSLLQESEEWWNLNQHYKEVHLGDAVAIWISGQESGIYALGSVVDGPVTRADSPEGQTYWYDKAIGQKVKARARVRYSHSMVNKPLLKVFLEADPELWNLQIIRSPRGTNFPMKPREWSAMTRWIEDV